MRALRYWWLMRRYRRSVAERDYLILNGVHPDDLVTPIRPVR